MIFSKAAEANRTGSFFEIILKKKNPGNYLFPGKKRRRPDLNRWILVLQTIALPLGYCAINEIVEKSFSDFSVTPTGIEPVLPP